MGGASTAKKGCGKMAAGKEKKSGKSEFINIEQNRRQKIHQIFALENTTPCDDVKKHFFPTFKELGIQSRNW